MTQEYFSEPAQLTEFTESPGMSGPSIVLLFLMLFSLILRSILAHHNVYPSYDGTFYLNTARDLVALGKLHPSGFPPGYPFLVAVPLFGMGWASPQAPLIAGQMINVIAGTSLGLLSYHLARRSFLPVLSLVLAGIMLFVPLSLQLSASDLSDLSFACFLLGGWLFYLTGRMGLAGLIWGYSYLIRPEGLMVVVLVGSVALIRRRRQSWQLLVLACIPIIPYVLFSSASSGTLTLSQKWIFLERAVQAHPGLSLLAHYARNASELATLLIHTLGPIVVVLALVGFVVKPGLWVVCCSPIALLPIFDFRMDARFLIPYLPFALLAAAHGFEWIVGKSSRFGFRRMLSGVVALVTIATVLITGYGQRALLRGNSEYYPAMREAGLWLRERVSRDTIIAGRKPYVSFWAWCQYRRIPDTQRLETLVDWAEAQQCEYLIVHVGVALGMAPVLIPLIEGPPPNLRDRIRLLRPFVIPGQPNETTFLYRILDSRTDNSSSVGSARGRNEAAEGLVPPASRPAVASGDHS
jgi:hypothetical protein